MIAFLKVVVFCWLSSLINSPDDLEIITVKVFTIPNVIICLVYIPPNVTDFYFNSLLMYLRSLHGYHKFIIMGDFNFPDIDWDTITGSNRSSFLFCDLTFDLNFSQLIHHPTHMMIIP